MDDAAQVFLGLRLAVRPVPPPSLREVEPGRLLGPGRVLRPGRPQERADARRAIQNQQDQRRR